MVQRLIVVLAVVLVGLLALQPLSAQDEDAVEPLIAEPPFGAVFVDDPAVGVLALTPAGEAMGVLTERNSAGEIESIRGATWQTVDGETLSVMFGPDGLPERMIVGEVVFGFENYTESTADVTILLPDGTGTALTGVPIPQEALDFLLLAGGSISADPSAKPLAAKIVSPLSQRSAGEILSRSAAVVAHIGSAGLSIVACGASAVALATSAVTPIPDEILAVGLTTAVCGSAAVTVVSLPETFTAFGNAILAPEKNIDRLFATDERYRVTFVQVGVDLGSDFSAASVPGITATLATLGYSDLADNFLQQEVFARRHQAALEQIRNNPQPFAAPNLTGTWNTTYGEMTFGEGRGEYTSDNGRLIYSQFGAILNGFWVEDGSSVPCSSEKDGSQFWGRITFVFDAELSSFVGFWNYCNDTPTRSWTGTRQSE